MTTLTRPASFAPRLRLSLLLIAGGTVAAMAAGAFYFRSVSSMTPQEVSAIPVTAVKAVPMPLPARAMSVVKTPATVRGASDSAASVQAAYRAGDYAQVEAQAHRALSAITIHTPVAQRRAAVQVRKTQAFAAARRKNLSLARERFALLKIEAAQLPDHGAVAAGRGEGPHATLEEDAAYQHAVCTVALGDRMAGEAEYLAFMKAYPESPLVSGCIKRIARLHSGDVPKEAEAVWRQAMTTAQTRETERQRQASLCGPESLAYALSGGNKPVAAQVASLAKEMRTDRNGTSIGALEAAAQRHGYPGAQAAQMTAKGLREGLSKGPVVALIEPGHFVVVTEMNESGVTRIWDANAKGLHRAGERVFLTSEWQKVWNGGFGVSLGGKANKGR